MKIALTHPHSWPEVRRGAERMIVEKARSLAAAGHDVTVFTAGSEPVDEEREGYRLVRFRQRHPAGAAHQRWFGRRVLVPLARGGFDAVHSLAPHDAAASVHAARLRRALRLRPHRTVYEDLGNPYREKVLGGHERRARLRVIADVDVYACMSEFSRRMLERDFGRAGTVVPGGVRTADFVPRPRHEEPTILFSGALDRPEKHVALLLEAVGLLAETRPDVRLHLSGPGDVGPILDAAPEGVRDHVDVLDLGDPDGQADRYAQAWVTCLPTQWDSFGLVIVESLAAGTPVVVGDAGAPSELVTPETGRRTEPFTAEALAESLDQALDMAKDPDTVAACRALAAGYDWDEAITPLLVSIYADTDRR
ncbi:MAG TPA: glycosyltransferase family 4 protein [Iamia sp.]